MDFSSLSAPQIICYQMERKERKKKKLSSLAVQKISFHKNLSIIFTITFCTAHMKTQTVTKPGLTAGAVTHHCIFLQSLFCTNFYMTFTLVHEVELYFIRASSEFTNLNTTMLNETLRTEIMSCIFN